MDFGKRVIFIRAYYAKRQSRAYAEPGKCHVRLNVPYFEAWSSHNTHYVILHKSSTVDAHLCIVYRLICIMYPVVIYDVYCLCPLVR